MKEMCHKMNILSHHPILSSCVACIKFVFKLSRNDNFEWSNLKTVNTFNKRHKEKISQTFAGKVYSSQNNNSVSFKTGFA